MTQKRLKRKTKKELLEIIEVLNIEIHNVRQIVNDQNEHILMLYALLEQNVIPAKAGIQ